MRTQQRHMSLARIRGASVLSGKLCEILSVNSNLCFCGRQQELLCNYLLIVDDYD